MTSVIPLGAMLDPRDPNGVTDETAPSRWDDGSLENDLGPFLFHLLSNLPHDRRDDALKLFRPPSEEALDNQKLEKPPLPLSEPWPELKANDVLNSAKSFENTRAWYRFWAWLLAILLLWPATVYLIGALLLFMLRLAPTTVAATTRWLWHTLRRRHGANRSLNVAALVPPVLKTHWKPWALAYTWALYLLYVVILTRVPMRGGLRGILLPSKAPGFLHDQAEALEIGEGLVRSAREDLEMAKELRNITIRRRSEALRAALAASRSGEDEKFDAAFETFEARQKAASSAKKALKDAEDLVAHAKQVVKTQGCTVATGYLVSSVLPRRISIDPRLQGIADWAQDANDSYENLMTAITGVAFVGAGLTYGAIFGATRGSIGLMAWAFSLFIIALAIVIPVQALLRWCSRLDNHPFSTPRLWETFLAIGVYSASASVVAAISLLVVTVLSLHFRVSSQPYFNPNAPNWDAPLVFDVNPGPSAKFAFAFIGLGIFVILVVFGFFAAANGVAVFPMMRKNEMRDRIDDLEKQINGKPLRATADDALGNGDQTDY